MKSTTTRGFTLIEILVVIGIIAVLAAIVIVAINPARQFAQARNAARTSDVSAISNAIGQYMADNKGEVPSGITGSALEIKTSSGANICGALVPDYMAALPVDPEHNNGTAITDCSVSGGYTTRYSVVQDGTTERITVTAMDPELGQTISVTR